MPNAPSGYSGFNGPQETTPRDIDDPVSNG